MRQSPRPPSPPHRRTTSRGGPEDPDLALVEVRITHAHYWDVKDSKITQLFKMAKATVTGTSPTNLGESAEVRMTA